MSRTIYATGRLIALAESLEQDHRLLWENWQDPVTQRNYNFRPTWESYEAYLAFFTAPGRAQPRFASTVLRLSDHIPVGHVSLAPPHREPDVAVQIFLPYRGQGFGSEAVSLTSAYILEILKLSYVVAGIFEHNAVSKHVFEKAGYCRAPELDEAEADRFEEGEIVQLGYRRTSR